MKNLSEKNRQKIEDRIKAMIDSPNIEFIKSLPDSSLMELRSKLMLFPQDCSMSLYLSGSHHRFCLSYWSGRIDSNLLKIFNKHFFVSIKPTNQSNIQINLHYEFKNQVSRETTKTN